MPRRLVVGDIVLHRIGPQRSAVPALCDEELARRRFPAQDRATPIEGALVYTEFETRIDRERSLAKVFFSIVSDPPGRLMPTGKGNKGTVITRSPRPPRTSVCARSASTWIVQERGACPSGRRKLPTYCGRRGSPPRRRRFSRKAGLADRRTVQAERSPRGGIEDPADAGDHQKMNVSCVRHCQFAPYSGFTRL